MKALTLTLAGAVALIAIAGGTATRFTQAAEKQPIALGNFSVSLTVKDIRASKAFYENLDFKEVGGKLERDLQLTLKARGLTMARCRQGRDRPRQARRSLRCRLPRAGAALSPEYHDECT